jgi:hypothetical protein
MSKKKFQNHELDRIASALLVATRKSDEEIEKIIASPNLFESVKAGIEKEQARLKPRVFPAWNWQVAGAFAILTLAIIGTAAAIVFRAPNLPPQASKTNIPETKTIVAPVEIPPQIGAIEKPVTGQAGVRQADSKTERSKPQRRVRKTKPAQKPQPDDSEGEFYMLALAGNWEADAGNFRVVRAELSRAELSALGVNLPVENETQKIKTDLLVGANGVPKAIRFIE